MATNTVPPANPPDADIHLRRLLVEDADKGWFTSLRENLGWLLNRKEEPPLVVTSQPVPVKDIWGEYRYGRISGPASVAFHLAIIGLMLVVGHVAIREAKKTQLYQIFDPIDIAAYVPQTGKDQAGGGGGGDRSPLPASLGRLPKQICSNSLRPR